ncbi:MAG: choice-of-anchor J domain-containing protein, partial [Candidatus Cloacimonetes bacterium]|nr:choice-of-anchor J domain-containing protein [Candidatus Cloacimonadota bacterium]
MKKIVLCVLVSLLVVSLAWATEKVPVIRTTIKAPAYTPNKDDVLNEGFEGGVLPTGWTQEYVNGTVDWQYQNGGNYGNPPSAHTGSYNALFSYDSYDGYTTKLVTPELDLGAKTDYTLTFWHAQVDYYGDWDELHVYYKTSAAGAWTLLESYTTSVANWTERTIDLPNPCSTYYIAFEGVANWGYGVCIDDVSVAEFQLTIYDIQFTEDPSGDSPYNGQTVTVSGIVTATNSSKHFIQDGPGSWNGIYVYDDTNTYTVGDEISINAVVNEYYNQTQLYNVVGVTVLSTGNALPDATALSTFDVNAEPYEGVLVGVTNAECTNEDLGYGEWEVDDGSGPCVVDDMFYGYTPTLGILYNVTGPLAYTYSAYKIEPRDSNDVVLSPPTQDIVVTVTVDNYPSEASWNVWDYTNLSWYYPANQTFTTSGETQIDTLALPDGNYAVYCWDTYGDGGISGIVTNTGVVLVQWASTDYTDEGIFDFLVYQFEYGSLAGYVTEFSLKTPIEGANIVCGDYEGFSGPDGYYQIDDILVGTYDVTCEAEGFNVALVEDIEITVDDTTYQDFALTAPTMDIDDTPIVVEVLMNSTNDENFITIENNGNGPLDWIAVIDEPGKQLVSIPPATGGYPRGPYEVSSEKVPANLRPSHEANQPSFTLLRGSIGYGYEALSGGVVWLDTDVPDVLNTIFTPTWASYAGEYGIDNETHMYFFENDTYNLIYVDMATGDATTIGSTGLSGNMNDMACDRATGIMYGLYDANTIYTIDLTTGACTVVGPINNTGGLMIGIAIDGNGDMWGHDLGLDEIWYIDKTTGAGTSVGSTGFDANYAQSMAWDPETDIVYLAAFNNSNFFYELRIVDLFTGGTALVGGIYYTEITAFSFPGSAGPSWLTLDPFSGTIPPGGSCLSNVIFDATGIDPGTTLNADVIFTSDPDVGSVSVPAEMTVYFPENYVLEGFEDPEFPPFDWLNPDGYWRRFTNNAYQGDGYARVNWTHPHDANLISPFLNIASGDIISFYWINANLYDNKLQRIIGEDTLFVEISNDIFDPDSWETLIALSAEEEMEEYEEVMVYLPDMYIGNQARLRWRHRTYESAESRGIGLDNILMPEPFYPINFYLDPEEQADYDSLGATVEYSIDVYNTGIQPDRYNLSVVESKTRRDVLIDEGFDTFPPDGWTLMDDFQNNWGISNTNNAGGTSPEAEFTYTPDYGWIAYTRLVTPIINTTDMTLNLEFGYYINNYAGGYTLGVATTSDGGATWNDVWSTNPTTSYQEYVNIPVETGDVGSSTFQFCFYFYGDPWDLNYWYIDDVLLDGAGGGPGPGPVGWPASVSVPFIDVNPGEFGTFSVLVEIPEDAVEDDVNTTTVLAESREAPHIYHEADVITTAHPKDPYEPNDNFADATPIDYDFVSEGAQIYYNAYYFDKDIDIYTFDGLKGDVIYILFDIADTLLFDGAIALLDADSTLLASADDYWGGFSESLQYRLQHDGTFYVKLGVWYDVLMGPFKKTIQRTETTTYYTMSLELIPSPGVLVEPEELTLGIIQNGKDIASDILYITNTGDEGAINLDWDIEILMSGIEILIDEGFEGYFPPDGWQNIMITGHAWEQSSAYAHSGTYSAKYKGTSSGGTGELITPLVDLTLCENDILSFYIQNKVWAGDQNVCYLYISTDGGTIWTLIHTFDTDMPNFEYWEFDLESYDQTDNTFFKFVGEDNWGYGIYIDDVYMATGEAWAFADPEAGSVPQGATRTSTITCDDDAKGLDPGTYYAEIIVHNNALLQGASDVIVPLTLYVGESSGGLEGTVTFITTGDPIDSVKVSCGGFVAYTDSNGFYQFDPAPPVGTYNVKFEKPGFLTVYAPDVELGYWVTVLDIQMYFDGPRPRDLVAEGLHLCIDLTWRAPSTGGTTQVEYILDDGTYENGWTGNPGYELWFGNLFPVDDTGELISFDLYTEFNASAGSDLLEIDIFDAAHNLVGSSESFVPVPDTWTTISCPNVPFDGEFYAMIHYNNESAQSHWMGFDENGPNANAGLDWYTDGTTWALLHVVAGADPGVFMLRATAMVQGELREITVGDVNYTPTVLPGDEIASIRNSFSSKSINNPHRITLPGELDSYEVTATRNDLILEGYKLYREDVTTGHIAYIPIEDPRYYRDDIVEAYVEYTYWVTAIYTVGESGESNHASAIPICLNIEDFELDDGGYTSNDPAGWQWGHATVGPPNAHSGENLWGTVLNGNYINNASWTLDTPEMELTTGNCVLSFYHWYNTENSYDGGNVKISIDGGANWTVIIPEGGYPDDSITGLGGEPGYTANSGGWVIAAFDLVDYIGETASFRWHFGTDSSVNNYPGWYIDDVMIGLDDPPLYGALQGTVTDGDMNPIVDATIIAIGPMHPLERYCVETNEDGYYVIDPIIAQFYDFTCEAEGFVTFTDTFTVLPDETYIEDVIMGNPILRVEPDSILVILDPDQQETRYITVFNDGNALLIWDAVIEQLYIDFNTNRFEGIIATSPNSEVDPNQTTPYNPPSKDMWDILFAYDVDGPSGLTGLVSAETDGSYLYTTKWAAGSNQIAKFDLEGNFIEIFSISGVTCLRDLAYDGTYFYGSDASAHIWQMDFDAQTLVNTIPCPVAVRSIAYDDDNDAFWVNNWSEDIKLVDRSG